MDMTDRPTSIPEYKVVFYRTAQGAEPVREWLQMLDKPERLQLGKAIQMLQRSGPALPMPYSGRLGEGLYELRERIGKVRYRIFYAFDGGRIVVLLHAVTKDQRVVEADIAFARRRLKDYFERRQAR
jgi:phage-related protein